MDVLLRVRLNRKVPATAFLVSLTSVILSRGAGGGAGSGMLPLFLQEMLPARKRETKR